MLRENVFGLKSFHPEFDRLFAFGIDPVGGTLPSDQPSDWPAPEAVRGYVIRVRAALDKKLSDDSLGSSVGTHDQFSLETLLNVAIKHRLMHVETLAYMLHQLRLERKILQSGSSSPQTVPVNHSGVEIPSGMTTLGLSRRAEDFGWDNEYAEHTVSVPAFEIDQFKVTNRQYRDFVEAGGYETKAFWNEDDWAWKIAREISHPVFWTKANGEWFYRTMFEEIPLPLDWPVHVSHAEAMAYDALGRKIASHGRGMASRCLRHIGRN